MSNANDFIIENGVLTKYTGPGGDVEIPNSIIKIRDSAFRESEPLRTLVIPDSVTELGYGTFAGQTMLESVKLPAGITEIPFNLFRGCSRLREIDIPEGVAVIGSSAFEYCTALRRAYIPDSVTEMSYQVFYGCENLEEVRFPENLWKIGGDVFKGCPKLADEQGMIILGGVLLKYMGDAESVSVPHGIREIGNRAFQSCRQLRQIQIPDTVKYIGEFALAACESLEELDIPDSVETLEDYAIGGCTTMKRVRLPAGLKVIGRQLLSSCKALREISIPEGVTKIDSLAFVNCTGLEKIDLPPKLCEIGGAAFDGCINLKNIMLPEGVRELRKDVFRNCRSLTAVPLSHNIKTIEPQAFAGCTAMMNPEGFFRYNDTLHTYAGEETHVVLPGNVTRIAPGCFYGCKGLKSVVFPDTILRIDGGWPVTGYTTEENLMSVLSISRKDNPDAHLFFHCGTDFFSGAQPWMKDRIAKGWLYGLVEYSPETVAAIKKYVGRIKDRLFTEITEDDPAAITRLLSCGKVKPEKLQSYIRNCDGGKCPGIMAVLLDYQNKHVPKEKQEKLADIELGFVERTAKEWSKIYRWTEAEGAITLTKYKGHDAAVEIPWHIEGVPVTVIGKNAFKNNTTLEEIRMTPNIVAVMESAFEGCENLREIGWSENLKTVEKRAFYNCYHLTVIRFPESLKELGVNSFSSKFNFSSAPLMHLSEVYLPANIGTFKGFLGMFMDYHVQVHFAGKKTKITERDFEGASVTLCAPAGSKTEEQAKLTTYTVVAE